METSFDEKFALAQDRAEALKQLIPGTEDYYYYHCLHHEQKGQPDEVRTLLETWVKRHNWTTRALEIANRQALLSLASEPKTSFDHLRRQIGLSFNHQREVEGRVTSYPTALDPKSLSRDVWKKTAFGWGGRTDLSGFADSALDWLASEKLEGDRRRALLERLARPDLTNLVDLILADLKHKDSSGFGSMTIHSRLTHEQLVEMARREPKLLKEEAFVSASLAKLHPGPEVDWENEPAEKEAYLDRLWAFVEPLVPAFNALKAHVLYHRLDLDRSRGAYDRKRFQKYVEMPRHVSYAEPKFMERCEKDSSLRDGIFSLGESFEGTLLPSVDNDEPLVADFLSHFFVDAKDWKPFDTWIQDRWLKVRFAEAKILNGVGDMEKWYSLLDDPGHYQALKDRVEITFPPHNATVHRAGDPVTIDVDVKNVASLVVKVFEINALNFYLARGEELDTSIDLDGLVAAEEKTHAYKEPPVRRVRRTFEFPSLSRPGLFVIEFIGGGISSRVLVRKGRLRFVERVGSAGHVFTVLDEDFKPLKDASIWLAGREYAADKEGAIAVPFTERPGRQTILLRQDTLTTLETFDHRAESYAFTAGLYVDREALVRRTEAQLLVRPSLRLHDAPVSLKLVEQPTLVVRSTDRHGVDATMEIRGLELHDDRETVVPFQVPDDLASISFALRGRVESLSLGKKIDFTDERAFTLNGIDATDKTEDLHLARTDKGFVLNVLGKTGEARPDTPVNLAFRHRHFTFEMNVTLQADARGRVELGPLEGITQIGVSIPSGISSSWTPPRDSCLRPSTLHVRSGETIRVPFMGEGVTRESVALLERVGDTYRADHYDDVSVKDGYLVVGKLPAGDYELVLKEENATIELRVTGGTPAAGWLASPKRLLQASPEPSVQISRIKAGKDDLRISLENASPATRVHVIGTRYLPGHSAFHELGREGLASPWAVFVSVARAAYVSGRDIGDEYRYILERKHATPLPGNMLTRPGLLLNPWAVRSTQTGVAEAAGGEGYGAAGAPCASMAAPRPGGPECAPPPAGAFSSLDFLAHPAAVIANLVPERDGSVTLPRKVLAHSNQVRVVVVDSSGTASRDVFLAEVTTAHRDLRLRLGLDPGRHFTEKKDVSVLDDGQKLEIADLTTSKLETYDTIGRAFTLYRTLSGIDTLDAFEFITRWPKLGDEEKRAKYSEFACHELHLFLSRKDPDFFKKVIQPYLKNKKDKTFLDHYLVEDDLARFCRPWEFGRLNIIERILLGKRIAKERGPLARHASDLCDLLLRDIARENHLFDTALKGKSLETGDALGIAAATVAAEMVMDRDAMRSHRSMAGLAQHASESKMDAPADDGVLGEMEAQDEERSEEKAKKEAPAKSAKRMASEADFKDADLRRRGAVRPLYRTLDRTQEWAENNYYKLTIEQQGPELVTVNRFWRDYARHDDKGPFLSVHLAEASRCFTEILCALAVIDLPFEAGKPATSFDGPRMELKPKGRMAVFHRQIKPAEPAAEKVPILVSQNFLRDNDRVRHEGPEQFDKYVTEEFLVHTVYACQVVLTNPTSSPHKLDLLLQIPLGALPANNGFQTRGIHVELAPYATQSLEYAFYFPVAGSYDHYPVHVSRNEQLIASAVPWPIKVVDRLSRVDTTSWAYLSQHADPAATLKYLDENNIDRLDLEKVAWRMRDEKFYEPALDLLARRHVYHPTLWSYAVHHKDPLRVRDFLLHQDPWLQGCGLRLESPVVAVDPVERRWYEHLEYAPLVNARAHRLGASRRILNNRFAWQFARLMSTLRYRAKPADEDLLAVSYYLFLQDRVEEGLATFDRVRRDAVEGKIQYDYLKIYAEFYREKPKAARAVAEKYKDYPVDRWRKLFRNALAQLDEIEGDAAAVADPEDRDQRQGRLAATASSFDFTVEKRTVTVHFQNLERARVNYYRMDIELLFSRQPFVQEQSDRFGFIMPNRTDEVTLPKKGGVHSFPLPAEFNGANVVVEFVAEGRRVSKPCFAHELAVQVIEPYGQVRVAHRETRKPLAKAYVKAYARGQDGTVRFFKDGYTDLRGRFDYSSLSTDDLDRVDRFALLVLSDEHGAVVQEAAPPKR